MRSYSRIQGTVDLLQVYGVNRDRDKTLKDLGYTYQAAKDNFPAFFGLLELKAWSQAECLNLYEFECAWNDAVWSNDTYVGQTPYYLRPGNVTQSRAWVQAPDGWFRVRYGCMTGLGRYSGKHAQVYGESTGNNVGSTPGTAVVIDHAGWISARQPERNCLFASAWGQDYGVVGGLAYSEGVIVENLRFVGGITSKDNSFKSYGLTLADPGENSAVRYCMSTNFNNSGYIQMGGTPAHFDTCSSFNNEEAGFDLLGTSGLHDSVMTMPSGDNNKGGLIRMRASTGGVCGGTLTINGLKSESRGIVQRILVVEGPVGIMNVTMNGPWANYEQGAVAPELIEFSGNNSSGGANWQIHVNGLTHSSNVQSLMLDKSTGKRYKAGAAFKPISFVVNDEGIQFSSRTMTIETGTVTPPTPVVCTGWTTGPWSAWGPCVNGQQTRTRTVTPTPAGCTGTPPNKPVETETQACSATPPSGELSKVGWTATATAVHTSGYEGPEKAIDGNPTTRYTSGRAQAAGDNLTITLPTPTSMSRIVFDCQGDYPGSYRIEARIGTSNTWTRLTPTTNPAGAPVMEVSFTKRNVKAYRLVVVGPRPVWLSCQETSAFA